MDTDLLLYANFYHNLGMNITHISGEQYISAGNQSILLYSKKPTDPKWEKYIIKKQNIEYLYAQQWDKATGLGIVLGYNQYRAIDIDEFLFCCLWRFSAHCRAL